MIRRLLIANRGEIAVRIVRACRELGVESVAVYSDADAGAPHVSAADRAMPIGPSPASESYLSIHKLIDAARASGADAVHPGYGFLSENAAFADACEQAGLVFVGPSSTVIARMGSKLAARELMESIGVPVVPGETPSDQSDEGLRIAIERVGFPALIKASAGGGGKGMRAATERGGVLEAIGAARREALAAFGDGTLYVERLLTKAHHVEVQIFGDSSGQIFHLFERECSVQRRHQKVIEESPSPALTPALRAQMITAAVKAAAGVGYRNAGTVEFMVEGSGDDARFYFMEMNTRLQVEHGVTEETAGVDLVRAQLLVASGAPLSWPPLVSRGHAIEARVYAEDPSQGFLPQAGRLLRYREPRRSGVRIDSGVTEGTDVSVYYDPLLAKVIASGESREVARTRLVAALQDFPILGIRTNVPYLLRILEHHRFKDASIDTSFLDREGSELAHPSDEQMPAFVRAALDALDAPDATQSLRASPLAWDPWQRLERWRG